MQYLLGFLAVSLISVGPYYLPPVMDRFFILFLFLSGPRLQRPPRRPRLQRLRRLPPPTRRTCFASETRTLAEGGFTVIQSFFGKNKAFSRPPGRPPQDRFGVKAIIQSAWPAQTAVGARGNETRWRNGARNTWESPRPSPKEKDAERSADRLTGQVSMSEVHFWRPPLICKANAAGTEHGLSQSWSPGPSEGAGL